MFHLEGVTPNSFKLTKIVSPDDPNEVLLFDGKGFSGSSFRARDEEGNICTFNEINDYIKTHLTPEQRTKLFSVYADIDNYFDNSNQMRRRGSNIVDTFDSGLARHVSKIFDIVKFKGVKEYTLDAFRKGKIRIPDDIYDDYRIDNKMQQMHIDCTYLKDDYLELISLSLYLRLMIPIWGRYLPITRLENRHELKEYYALKLISGTPLFREHVFSRLDTYVKGTVKIEDDLAIMIAGLSYEEIPFFMMAQIVVKRLPIFSISYSTDSDRNRHLMSMMYHLIGDGGKSRTSKIGALLKNTIIEKKPIETEWSSEDNSSVWDMYKTRELVSGGDLAITEVYIMNYYNGDNPELTHRIHEYIKTIDLQKITPVQIQLMTWVMSVLVPGNTVPLFEGYVLRKSLAIAQSQLWTWGFDMLAILLTAEPVALEQDVYNSNLGRKPITSERRVALDKIYGLYANTDTRTDNVGVVSIQEMSRNFFETDWAVNCVKELYKDNEDISVSPIFATPGDLRNHLADLLIKLS